MQGALSLYRVLYHYTGCSVILQGVLSFYRVFYHSTGCYYNCILHCPLSSFRLFNIWFSTLVSYRVLHHSTGCSITIQNDLLFYRIFIILQGALWYHVDCVNFTRYDVILQCALLSYWVLYHSTGCCIIF